MSEQGKANITDALRSQMQRQDDLLDVVVELEPDRDEPATAPEMRESFERSVQPVSAAISEYGGEVVDAAWLNRTLRAKVPAVKVADLGDLKEVAALDVPRQIQRD